uniref:Uncharacterized protein n=1 Tax=Arundo donax TaxID=35708 RepID=A0A0A9FL11_ARUDO
MYKMWVNTMTPNRASKFKDIFKGKLLQGPIELVNSRTSLKESYSRNIKKATEQPFL